MAGNQKSSMKVEFIDTKKATKEALEKKAELFSEGDNNLKDLLLAMWDKGITTYACCAGHENHPDTAYMDDMPYLYFDVTTLTKEQYKSLIGSLCNKFGEELDVEFENRNDTNLPKEFAKRKSLNLRFGHTSYRAFEGALECFNKAMNNPSKEIEADSKIQDAIEYSSEILDLDLEKIYKYYEKRIKNPKQEGIAFINGRISSNGLKDLKLNTLRKSAFKLRDDGFIVMAYEGLVTKEDDGCYYTLVKGKIKQVPEKKVDKRMVAKTWMINPIIEEDQRDSFLKSMQSFEKGQPFQRGEKEYVR